MDLDNNSNEFIPVFNTSLLKPRYWLSWLLLALVGLIAYLPSKIRDPFAGVVGRSIGKLAKKARLRAQTNLRSCLPELSFPQRETIIDHMFATAPQAILTMASLALSRQAVNKVKVKWHGRHIIDQLRAEKQNVIFLVPHGWSVDIPAMLLAAEGQKMAAMFHNQKNQLIDYVWNKVRRRFGGRLHARNDGIMPFIRSVRQGYWGYYLPDQDHGAEQSEFVDFFATYKATLPIAGRLMKVCRARIVPLFPVYNSQIHQLEIFIRPPMDDIKEATSCQVARRMNQEVEILVRPHLEQYTWILKLLKTRRPGEGDPYKQRTLS